MKNEDLNSILQGMADAERRHQNDCKLIAEYEAIQRRDIAPYKPEPENPMQPVPEYPPASSAVHYKRILITVGTGFAVYSVWAFVAANAVWVGGAVVLLVCLSGLSGGSAAGADRSMPPGNNYSQPPGNGGQNINITVNAANGGNVTVDRK